MSKKLFDALEICLQALEKGETIDSVLGRFPAQADRLRPILEASLHARALSGPAVPNEVQRRARARLLQRAAQMREAKRAPRRTWLYTLRPLAVALMLVIFFLSGTGLVRASTTSLPGDNLYPVKRTWEDIRLIFVSSELEREGLELAYENERLEEIQELLAEGRDETVSFVGYVTAQADTMWSVAGVPVIVSPETSLPERPILIGEAVTVTGRTDAQGFLAAHSIEPVPPGTVVPPLEDSDNDNDPHEDKNNGGASGGGDADGIKPGDDSDSDDSGGEGSQDSKSTINGVVQNVDGAVWVVDGQAVDVSEAEIVGVPSAGASVTVEGYVNADGVFVATKVIFDSAEGDSRDSDGQSSDSSEDDHDGDEEDEPGEDEGTPPPTPDDD